MHDTYQGALVGVEYESLGNVLRVFGNSAATTSWSLPS